MKTLSTPLVKDTHTHYINGYIKRSVNKTV